MLGVWVCQDCESNIESRHARKHETRPYRISKKKKKEEEEESSVSIKTILVIFCAGVGNVGGF